MSNVRFEDFSVDVKNLMEDKINSWIYEISGEIESRVKRNTRVDTGQLKSSWKYRVFRDKKEAVIGSPLENSLWEEFGTGEYALKGNGRKGGWLYKDFKGRWRYTKGKTPTRAFQRAYDSVKNKAKEELARRLKDL